MKKHIILIALCAPIFLQAQFLKPLPEFSETPLGEVSLNVGDQTPQPATIPSLNSRTFQSQGFNKTRIDSEDRVVIRLSSANIPGRTVAEKELALTQRILQAKDLDGDAYQLNIRQSGISESGKHESFQLQYNGVPVFGSEVTIHKKEKGEVLILGRLKKVTPAISTKPSMNLELAVETARAQLKDLLGWADLTDQQKKFLPGQKQEGGHLVVLNMDGVDHLCWALTVHPNLRHRWEIFVDAHSGEIIRYFPSHCQLFHGKNEGEKACSHSAAQKESSEADDNQFLPGPLTANALDLFNVNRTINVWEEGGLFYMIDASREMFNPSFSNFPDEPQGVVWTLDAQNGSPQSSNFNVSHVGSNNNTWADKVSVSAHYNGGVAYEYFRTVHNRNSINGQGGNVISIVNITNPDGSDMDNAFWNGTAMFYGNGAQAFNAPLAKGLDVAGHEIAHGVIQGEANLVYQVQSGALNESFADVFGAMIDRDDWQIGEDISNPSVFPSGTMRDMQDPHNGGTSSNFYWQPKHMDEYVNLPNTQQGDWGGVHINSGIPNHAFYLFATDVGKATAEQVYYDVLANYLVSHSEFIDMRIAVVDAAESMFGPTVKTAAENAFSAVGIGAGAGNDFQMDNETNPGDDIVLWADGTDLGFYFTDMSVVTISGTNQSSRPSISDDGTVIVFIDDQNRIKVIEVDYGTGDTDEYFLENDPQTIWRNISVSKDATKLALLTTEEDNKILVYDFDSGNLQEFTLENPTTSNPNTGGGSTTGDVKFADVLEWDITGENLLYDAFNELTTVFSEDISYWDIGVIQVWDKEANTFVQDGAITKLFTGLQENESLGNPTWSKDSPYIIAFDYRTTDFFNNPTYTILGANLETGEIGTIWENSVWGYPSYSPDDTELLFSSTNTNSEPLLGTIPLATDKINANGSPVGILLGPAWGLWYANGDRPLVGTHETEMKKDWKIVPNPTQGSFQIYVNQKEAGIYNYQLRDVFGRLVQSGELDNSYGDQTLDGLPSGSYFISIFQKDENLGTQMLVKQ
ncbi:MAG: T9SS type A sorting domain-containing protein [Saprospiraceae bacterium]|nr:T9SS type A sorting domain-containing protein [Saprospiraceae bacterium]